MQHINGLSAAAAQLHAFPLYNALQEITKDNVGSLCRRLIGLHS